MAWTSLWIPICAAVLFSTGCGDEAPSGAPAAGSPGSTPTSGTPAGVDTTAAGAALGKEMLDAFAALVDEAHGLVRTKPAAQEVLPKLTALIGRYEETMTALARRHEALPDVHAQRAVRRHVSEHRPAAVHRSDELLGEFVFHYRGVDANPDVVAALTTKLVGVLDIALP